MTIDVAGFFDWLVELWQSFANIALSALPSSPIQSYIEQFAELPYLSYINWFVPVGTCVEIMGFWLTAVGLYYLYSVIMRWAKLIR